MLANIEPLQQLMDLIEIPVLVQEKVNAALEELQELLVYINCSIQ